MCKISAKADRVAAGIAKAHDEERGRNCSVGAAANPDKASDLGHAAKTDCAEKISLRPMDRSARSERKLRIEIAMEMPRLDPAIIRCSDLNDGSPPAGLRPVFSVSKTISSMAP